MIIHKRNVTSIEPLMEVPVTANEAITVGEALKIASGKLTKGTATAKPTYIAAGTVAAGTDVMAPVYQVLADMEFEANIVGDASALTIGSKVTIGSNGVDLTATTSSGVAEIVEILDTLTTAGGRVVVRF